MNSPNLSLLWISGFHLRNQFISKVLSVPQLVDLVDALGLPVDLLKSYRIRTNGLDHFGDSFQIQLPADTGSMMNVIAAKGG